MPLVGGTRPSLRSEKVLDCITDRHLGLHALQRIRLAMYRARNDPARMHLLRHPMQVFLNQALLDLETVLFSYLDQHPDLYLAGEALAGMASPPAPGHYGHPIFKKPPSIAINAAVPPMLSEADDCKVELGAVVKRSKPANRRGDPFWSLPNYIRLLGRRAWAKARAKGEQICAALRLAKL